MKYLLFVFLFVAQPILAAENPLVVMKTNFGEIEIELFQKKSPLSTTNFLRYVNEKFYDGTIFHRVIDNYIIQGGGLTTDYEEKKVHGPIRSESLNELKNVTGTISMARTKHKHSATSQFFINIGDNKALNYAGRGSYGFAVFGKVVKGMSVVHKIKKVKTARVGLHKNVPIKHVVIESVRVKN